MPKNLQKLYCYVDESGQDTKGRFFLVAIVITGEEREVMMQELEKIEGESGKGILKWKKTSVERRVAYLEKIFANRLFAGKISCAAFFSGQNYQELTIEATAKAIVATVPDNNYEATVYVDGLSIIDRFVVTAGLRNRRIHVKRVRGIRDESNALIRLADAIAGFVRDDLEGDQYVQPLHEKYTAAGLIKKL
jgi:hypothetical protein